MGRARMGAHQTLKRCGSLGARRAGHSSWNAKHATLCKAVSAKFALVSVSLKTNDDGWLDVEDIGIIPTAASCLQSRYEKQSNFSS